jgi:hypothetical protein
MDSSGKVSRSAYSGPLPRNEVLGTNPCAGGGTEVPRGTSGSIEVVLGGGKEKIIHSIFLAH